MITIHKAVKDIILEFPFLEELLIRDLINYSALARQIRPTIENRLYKTAAQGSIIMALKRLRHSFITSPTDKLDNIINQLNNISIHDNITSFTYSNSPTIHHAQNILIKKIVPNTSNSKNFLSFTGGLYETMLFVSSENEELVEKTFSAENLLGKIQKLCCTTLILPTNAYQTPGLYYSILKKLALNNINIIEIVSSSTELTIYFNKADLDRALVAIKSL